MSYHFILLDILQCWVFRCVKQKCKRVLLFIVLSSSEKCSKLQPPSSQHHHSFVIIFSCPKKEAHPIAYFPVQAQASASVATDPPFYNQLFLQESWSVNHLLANMLEKTILWYTFFSSFCVCVLFIILAYWVFCIDL